MAQAAARKSQAEPTKKKGRGKLRAVPDKPEPPVGDETLTLETMAAWTDGQKKCRGRKRHNWGPSTVFEHSDHYDVHEICSHCKNKRHAPYVPTSRGLRKVDKWQPVYKDGYLLPKGAMRIDEDLQDELTAADILSRRIIEVPDEDEE